ncbi:GNAT family N-acetyltransferase [Planococcus sp. ISL-110]|uniref:GNAT family N-acetyltransferase n=1 Tax=Planococcus sp. ISL-110 TaxID=2819167 RepID=UPI001BED14FD|nr:GNAT family N-acetyltransferase [Planococcus sp. ISL-110]MBT2569374.1 GNAT family N-acetyltransferase [Planococcus sp. ISL-110]
MILKLDHQDKQIAKEIQQIQQAAYRVEAELMGFDAIPQLNESITEIQKSTETFAGYSEGQLQGVISYQINEGTVDIHRLVVSPGHFRKGIGKQLVGYLLKHCKGYEFTVSTGTANKPAIALYKAFGFQEQCLIEVAPGIYCTLFYLSN